WLNKECAPLASRFGWSGRRFDEQTDRLRQEGRHVPEDRVIREVGTENNPFLAWLRLKETTGEFDPKQPVPAEMLPLPDLLSVRRNQTLSGNLPALTLDALDNPVLAWAELESYRVTGDGARLARVWTPLTRYYDALRRLLRVDDGLYTTDFASMDNSPR